MKTAYSYLRWSTAIQGGDQQDSFRRQNNSAIDWIKNHGRGKYKLASKQFIDSGKSGYSGKHIAKDEFGRAKGELQKFIQGVESGSIKNDSILLIDEFSRFSRLPPVKSLNLFLNVINSGIGLVFTSSYDKRVIDSGLIDKDPHVLQFIIGEMIRAYSESNERSKKIKSAKQLKLDQIQSGMVVCHNTAPRYFTFIRDSPNKRITTGHYIHNEKTEVVKQLVRDYLRGHSLYSIAKKLNDSNVPPIKMQTRYWSPRSVRSILQSRALIGEYLGNPNFFPPIITQKEYDRLQLLIKQNAGQKGKRADLINVFRGIAFCVCGRRMNVATQSFDYRTKKRWKRVYRYFRCSGAGVSSTCHRTNSVDMDIMEGEFFAFALKSDPKQLIAQNDTSKESELNLRLAERQKSLQVTTDEIERLVTVSESIPLDELKTKLGKLQLKRDKLKSEIDSLNLENTQMIQTPEQVDDLKAIFDTPDTDENLDMIDAAYKRLEETLKDNEVRMKIRVILPNIISKIICHPPSAQFWVLNLAGQEIFRSQARFEVLYRDK